MSDDKQIEPPEREDSSPAGQQETPKEEVWIKWKVHLPGLKSEFKVSASRRVLTGILWALLGGGGLLANYTEFLTPQRQITTVWLIFLLVGAFRIGKSSSITPVNGPDDDAPKD